MSYRESAFAGVRAIEKERERQYYEENFREEHDDQHSRDELAYAAVVYALPEIERNYVPAGLGVSFRKVFWPHGWTRRQIEPEENVEQRIRNLAKAGALIAAEIDRLSRI